MQNAALSSAGFGAIHSSTARPGLWKAVSLFGLGLMISALAILSVALTVSKAAEGFAFVVPMTAILAGTAWLVRTRRRWAQGFAAVVALAMGALIAPIAFEATIDSFFDIMPVALMLTGIVAVLAGSAADLSRRQAGEQAPPMLLASGLSVVALLGFLGIVSAIATYAGQDTLSGAQREGATRVATKDSAFTVKKITVTEGETVRIALKNSDPVIHDLRIKSLDIKQTVKPGSEKLVEFVAPEPGTYAFDCSLHTNMKGTLEVLAR